MEVNNQIAKNRLVKNQQDFWSGVMFIAFGLGFTVFAQEYDMGTSVRMGPAFFPIVLGVLLIVLGLAVLLQSLRRNAATSDLEKFHFDSLAWVLSAVIAFALLLRPAGLVVALIALILIAGRGSHDFKWKELVLVTVGLVLLVLAVFVWGLGLTLPVWPAFVN